MEASFYKTRGTIEVLPCITFNKVCSGGRIAHCLMIGWLQWMLDIQWVTGEKA